MKQKLIQAYLSINIIINITKMSKYGISLDLMKDSEVELIKDFLKIKGYRRTLECLIKEERYKNIENRNLKVFNIKI